MSESKEPVIPEWRKEANAKLKELESKVPAHVPKDVKGRPLPGRSTRLSKQATKLNLGFDATPMWADDILIDEIHADYQVNVANIVDPKARPSFPQYLISQVMPTLTSRYTDLMNSCMHHEMAVEANKDIAPLTRVEAEKAREVLDKTTEAVLHYLRSHGLTNIEEVAAKWKAARDWLAEVLNVLPSGEGVYRSI